ncbi:unnamed protein product [Closterium sp. Yama58-4]|nr:unnamed protein product [Closterium sp. Yama58-4]
MAVCCWDGSVLLGWQCAALLGWQCAALLGWQCAALLGWQVTCWSVGEVRISCACCFVLRHAASCCAMLLRVAPCCFVLRHAASCCAMLLRVAPCCFVLRHAASCCAMLLRVAPCCFVLRHAASCCAMLLRVAPCCFVLRHAASCCAMLLRVAPCCFVLRHAASCCIDPFPLLPCPIVCLLTPYTGLRFPPSPPPLAVLLSPFTSGAPGNYLIGTVPPLGPLLLRIDVNYNFITDLPSAAYTWCGGTLNCLVTPSKCTTSGTVQRSAADCAFCGTTNGIAPFCWGAGGVCTLDAAALVAAGTTNSNSQPALPRTCVGGPVVALKDTTAMLALKSSLGVTFTTWAATVPCTIAGQTTSVTVWSGVLCDSTGRVVSM